MYSLFVTNNDKRSTGKFILDVVSVFLGFQFETLIPKIIFLNFRTGQKLITD